MTVNSFQKEIKNIVEQIKIKYRPEKIILYGSVTTGKITENSDIDMLIIKRTKRRFVNRISDVLRLCDYSIPFEPIVYTPEEIEQRIKLGDFFIMDILKKGKVLYG